MGRPTIADVAIAANVSVSTVDRVLNGRDPVRRPTAEKVLSAAQSIGFYAEGLIRQRLSADKPAKTLGFLLLQRSRTFYQMLGKALSDATAMSPQIRGKAVVQYLDSLEPIAVAAQISKMATTVDVLAIIAANHPHISSAVDTTVQSGIPVFGLISELSATEPVGYIGLDNYKVGRTAAWSLTHICKTPGKVAIIMGSHRFRSQDLNEMGFRSYLREHAPEFKLLEPLTSMEDANYAAEITRDLINRHPDLSGIYVAGGGLTGVVNAIKEHGLGGKLVTVCHDLTPVTQAALIDGTITLSISHPLERMAVTAVEAMAAAATGNSNIAAPTPRLPFEILTSENI